MKIEYTVTKDMFFDFQIEYINTSKAIQSSIFSGRIKYAFIYLVGILGVHIISPDVSPLFSLGIMVPAGILQILTLKRSVVKKTLKAAEILIEGDGANGILGVKQAIILDDKWLQFNESQSETKLEIKSIAKIGETSNNCFLYKDEMSACIIPKIINGKSWREGVEFVEKIRAIYLRNATKQDFPMPLIGAGS